MLFKETDVGHMLETRLELVGKKRKKYPFQINDDGE